MPFPINGQAVHPEGLVGAGIDSLIVQDGRIVTYASGVNFSEDWELQGIRTLGWHGDRDFKSMGYTANATIETFVLRGQNVEGALHTPGWQWDGSSNINKAGMFDFCIMDLYNLEVLFSLIGTKLASQDIQFPASGLNTKSTQWKVMRILPGLASS